jgi:hypothetical protein
MPDAPVSPFRDVWTSLGRLRERPEVEDSPEARELGRLLAVAIDRAEQEWRVARQSPSEN